MCKTIASSGGTDINTTEESFFKRANSVQAILRRLRKAVHQ